ncbi:MAG: RecX family transcriptional regulator, partial [Eggerthella sp.]|nr:RecX family transcriptional regulator [Eggerthella sp.]
AAIDRALSVGYLDDARFADVLVRSRLRSGKGLSGILRELRAHAIDPYEQLEGFPDDYLRNNLSQEEAAIALLRRKPPRSKNEKQAAYAKLIRSGYSADIAANATKRWYKAKNNE